MENSITLKIGNLIELYDHNELDMADLEELKDLIQQANNQYQHLLAEGSDVTSVSGILPVSDALYDRAMDILRELAPDSELANQVWSTENGDEVYLDDEFAELRREFPMKSIEKVQETTSNHYQNFKHAFPTSFGLMASLKLNGWGIELFYKDGSFTKGVSRGRASVVDITDSLKPMLTRYGLLELEQLKGVSLCSVRGELILRNDRLELARQYKPSLVSPLSAIPSLLGSKTPDSYKELLSFRAYRYIEHDVELASKFDEYKFLEELGFKLPLYYLVDDVQSDNFDETIELIHEDMLEQTKSNTYFSDGIVVMVNSTEQFKSLGGTDRYDNGAMALKMGAWEQNLYKGYVQYVTWSKGKTKLTPEIVVADQPNKVVFVVNGVSYKGLHELQTTCPIYDKIADSLSDYVINRSELGIPTAHGNRVRNVPAYNLAAMIDLGVKSNGVVHFRYGGETGVIICDSLGNTRKEFMSLQDTVAGLSRP